MSEQALQYDVDEETGEILVPEGADPKTETLPRLARAMVTLKRRIAMIEAYRKAEVERITASCDNRAAKLAEQLTYLEQTANGVFSVVGEKKLEYPGLGVFRLSKTRVSVDSSDFDSWGKDLRDRLAAADETLFRSKTVYSPDKDAIKKALLAGVSIMGFELKGGDERMVFVPEGD